MMATALLALLLTLSLRALAAPAPISAPVLAPAQHPLSNANADADGSTANGLSGASNGDDDGLSVTVPSNADGPLISVTVPFYGTSANGHTSAARGWNSFGLQANPAAAGPGFAFDDAHFAQQCEFIQLPARVGVRQSAAAGEDSIASTVASTDTAGAAPEYYCSLDSGWSGNGGDPFGRIVPEPSVFTAFPPVLKGLADHLHARGLKLGLYLLPGAFESDQDVVIEVRLRSP